MSTPMNVHQLLAALGSTFDGPLLDIAIKLYEHAARLGDTALSSDVADLWECLEGLSAELEARADDLAVSQGGQP